MAEKVLHIAGGDVAVLQVAVRILQCKQLECTQHRYWSRKDATNMPCNLAHQSLEIDVVGHLEVLKVALALSKR